MKALNFVNCATCYGFAKKLPANTAEVPDPSGPLSTSFPPETIIAANRQVSKQRQQVQRELERIIAKSLRRTRPL